MQIEKTKNKKLLLVIIGIFVLVFSVTLIIVNNSFGFKVSNNANDSNTFPDGYYLSNSLCVDAENNVVSNVSISGGNTVTIDLGQTVMCNLSFDKPFSSMITYDPSESHAQDANGNTCNNIQCALDGLYELYKEDNK